MVLHRKLIKKLESIGICGKILRWVESFLIGREQCVVVNGEKSSYGSVLSGIPQGSVLGPLLFVVYINDILNDISSDGILFADDTKLLREITNREDVEELQNDIKHLQEWAKRWNMEFNGDKCHVLTIGKFENTKCTYRYKLDADELDHVEEEKDLGVIVDSELDFSGHINKKISSANSIVGLIRRSFSFLDANSFRKLFCAFVRPHLEYGQAVWSPHLQKHIDAIEKVQMRATKLVDGLKKMPYEDRLRKCKLTTLRFRRLRGDMIEVYKHFNVYDSTILPSTFKKNERPSRQHDYQLCRPRGLDGERGIHHNFFYNRTVITWNNIPGSVVNARTINGFKNRLDTHWINHSLKYNHKSSTTTDDI